MSEGRCEGILDGPVRSHTLTGIPGFSLQVQILNMPTENETQGTNSNYLDSQKPDVQASCHYGHSGALFL